MKKQQPKDCMLPGLEGSLLVKSLLQSGDYWSKKIKQFGPPLAKVSAPFGVPNSLNNTVFIRLCIH